MKPWILLVLCLLLMLKSRAQEESLSVEIGYPITIDDNFIGSNFNGIIDIGGKYRFIQTGAFHIGTSFNVSLLTNPGNTDFGLDFTVTAFVIQSKGFIELKIPGLQGLRPFIGIGPTLFTFTSQQSRSDFEILGVPETLVGVNIAAGISYDIFERFFIQLQYDYNSVSPDDDVPDIPFNRNVSLLKAGVGYRFR